MNKVLASFEKNHIAVDLGCGKGSFHYETHQCRIIGIDVNLRAADLYHEGSRIDYVCGDSDHIPLAEKSVDGVICHNTMEHFPDYRATLVEINRVLKDRGLLWIAVPNGYALDDSLYRRVFSGGGHVNRFTRDGLVAAVHEHTRFRLKSELDLFSGFVYLKKPSAEEYVHFPPSARPLAEIPDGFSAAGVLAINAVTRLADKMFGSRLSQYGWGFVFGGEETVLAPGDKPRFNVCSRCGSGVAAATLRKTRAARTLFGLGIYRCPHCNQVNSFVEPPAGLE